MDSKLVTLLEAVARIPGLRFVGHWATQLIGARHAIRDRVDQAEEIRDNVRDSRRAAGDLMGGGDDDDKTVLRPRPGAGGGDDDRTVLRPTPGRRGAGAASRAAPRRALPEREIAAVGSGLNPLVDAATSLFSLVCRLRNTASHPDVAGLRQHVVHEVKSFDAAARNAGVATEMVIAARYALCTLVDETVLVTPWGSESAWSNQSVLSIFHNETWGGEKFFQMLDRGVQAPARNLDLLEFLYLCVALGLEGKYRVLERGRDRLDQVRDNLFRAIRGQRGEYERGLSPHWQGVTDRRSRLVRYVPLWVIVAFAGVLLSGAYMGFRYSLSNASDPVFRALQSIGRHKPAPKKTPPVRRTLNLRTFLAPEIKQGLVSVVERAGRTTVVIHGDGLFGSGRDVVKPARLPLIRRIAEALEKVKGKVLVTGHTDSVPIHNARFPSNWDLSQARAEAVLRVLAGRMRDAGRLTAEGRGDTEPVAGNDTAQGRARNRRVEITLMRSVSAG